MIKYRHHIFVCINQRPPGHPKGDCASRGSREVLQRFQEEMEKRQLWDKVGVNGATCLGPCTLGASVVVYPEGTWYAQVRPDDVEEIVEQHIVEGKPVERLLLENRMAAMDAQAAS